MATNLLSLYLDVDANRLVESTLSDSAFALPSFYQGDVANMRLYLLRKKADTRRNGVYEVLGGAEFSAYTIKVGLVTPHVSAPTVHTLALLVAASAAGENWYEGQLILNTVAIATLLGANTSASCKLEIQVSDGLGSISTEIQQGVTVFADGIKEGAPVSIPPDTYPTHGEVEATYVKHIGLSGESILLVSQDGTKKGLLYWGDDGSFHADPVT